MTELNPSTLKVLAELREGFHFLCHQPFHVAGISRLPWALNVFLQVQWPEPKMTEHIFLDNHRTELFFIMGWEKG